MMRFELLVALFFISLVDAVVPLPIFGFIALYIVLKRPPWFLRLVLKIYRRGPQGRKLAKKDH
ncbi:hypothetical protein [Methylogaea oryzae]|uniref:Uncharacterized protein n=1 Tax=Methylogaea oryzae TaxID=1295382 RepID=A0A8D4VQE8_9GAMM|nr:hypothetical protein [Methylogaea oryzae]BBL72155.1 hypothetical protein MoryE10_27610 [Methylogaea oryzae]